MLQDEKPWSLDLHRGRGHCLWYAHRVLGGLWMLVRKRQLHMALPYRFPDRFLYYSLGWHDLASRVSILPYPVRGTY